MSNLIAKWRWDLDHRDPKLFYILTMRDTGKCDNRGQTVISYLLTETTYGRPGSTRTLFQGADFSGSPMHADDSLECARSLMTFLTLRPGDTDRDYFESYAPDQLDWCKSSECEELQYLITEDYTYERVEVQDWRNS